MGLGSGLGLGLGLAVGLGLGLGLGLGFGLAGVAHLVHLCLVEALLVRVRSTDRV